MPDDERILLPRDEPVESLDAYLASGGGEALDKAMKAEPEESIEVVRQAGLRGRGGAGFPTARKWQSVRDSAAPRKFVCCNAAEGEPGTFKDRYLVRMDPYAAIEGLAIAKHVVGAEAAYYCMKRDFAPEVERVRRALKEFAAHTDAVAGIELVLGPDEYLFGEEKAMLEVIEGGGPLPRVFPPYLHGLFGATYAGPTDVDNNPTVVNNIETLSHVPRIISRGSDWYRSFGTGESPGTMIFTLSGDVQHPTVRELPLGRTLRDLIEGVAGGVGEGRKVRAVFPGVANAVITEQGLETPLGFDAMREAGSGLGSAGFVVYDDTACMAQVAYNFSRFLFIESCNQCAPCKLGSRQITERLQRLLEGKAKRLELEEIDDITTWVTNGQRCYLATSESLVISSVLRAFPDDFTAHLQGRCELRHDISLPKMTGYEEGAGFTFDEMHIHKQPDWSFDLPQG